MSSAYSDREKLKDLMRLEINRYISTHPRSREAHERALSGLVDGVPMIWMSKWPGPFPLYVSKAKGSRFTDFDGMEYSDFCLGDTGAMCG
ncbi:MAG: aspartate aminotransferase family protein, partial [Aquiluna sp.]